MKNLVHFTTAIAPIREPLRRSVWQRYFFFIPFIVALASFAFSLTARAVDPPPDGGYPNFNTAEGENALFSLTTGQGNTAIGWEALHDNTIGDYNTAVGYRALQSNIDGVLNTAIGMLALINNTSGSGNTALGDYTLGLNTAGSWNTALGQSALAFNDTGNSNTAIGGTALHYNTTGSENTAVGRGSLYFNTGSYNTAIGLDALNGSTDCASEECGGTANTATGWGALKVNTTGNNNVAAGLQALLNNTTGNENTAVGLNGLFSNTTGSRNTALGAGAGGALTTGSDNIDIGTSGVAGESATIRLGTIGTHKNTYVAGIYTVTLGRTAVPVFVDSAGHLGTKTSAARFKEAVQPMDNTSEAIHALQPVTFRYKKELDPDSTAQFGLIAEEVEKVNPDLVVRDEEGNPYSVRYEAVNAMLLNEFLKEHRKGLEQDKSIAQLESAVARHEATIAQQQKDFRSTIAKQHEEIEALTASLKEQASHIQKVSELFAAANPSIGGLEASKSSPQLVVNNQ